MQDKSFTHKERRTPITHSLIKGYVLKKTLDHHTEDQLMKKVIFKILIFVFQTHIYLIYVKYFPYSCKLGY